MRILMLSPYPPYPPRGGGALRIYHLLRGLAARHTVTLLSFAPDEAAAAAMQPLRDLAEVRIVIGLTARSLGQRALTTLASPLPDMALRNASPAYSAAFAELLANAQFEVVLAESIEMAPYLLQARKHRVRLALDEFNAEYLLQRRAALNDLRRAPHPKALIGGGYSLIQWFKLAAFERRVLHTIDRALVVSAEDAAALRRLAPHAQLHLVPNGVDCSHFAPQAAPPANDLVFIGTLDYRPNVDAVLWFTHEVFPHIRRQHPALRLRLIGRRPHPSLRALHDHQTIIVTGEVDDTRPALAAAAAVVIPMRVGGGSRLKLLEALAMAAPVVSTTMGAEGIPGLRDGEHLLLADTPAAMAAAVNRLVTDRPFAQRLGQAGRAFVCASYDWAQIVPKLEAALQA
ncbi:glycosyltransferase family 4 protein [Chloroflexus sp.]|uniref:glycosyltransferase family 4 protein n=1 Tax=Chloroflexus sp. TaxID=1904827 RepID=UPI002ACD7914|nr:glycosyltransferase family 4 protein [Chloroflexus sp.]